SGTAEDYARGRVVRRGGDPDRRASWPTERGRGELARWLAVPARYEPFRSELLLKLFLGDAGRAADSIAQIEHYEATQRGLLETYLGIERRLREEMAGHPQLPFSLVTLHYGQHRCRAMLAWCAESSRALKRLEGRRRCRRRR